MRILILLSTIIISNMLLLAQQPIQKGRVKTRGRMVNGKHVPGHGLPGAVVTIKGRNDVAVKNNDGNFSFPISGKHYFVQSVKKTNYELVDADITTKPYEYTSNVQYFVMETPEQLLQDKLDKEKTIRRTLNKQLQKREDEIEALKAENKISQQKYQELLQELYASQESNEKLISEMAERYAKLDYDQLDDFYRQVSNYIEEGELVKADSLLKTRGDLNSQIDEHLQQGAVIQQKKEELKQAESVHQFDKEELARRCYSYFENFKMQHQYDSAACYIEKRAMLDTTNVEWQFAVASYNYNQKQYHKSEDYNIKALNLIRRSAAQNSEYNESDLARTLNNLASLYYKMHRISESELMYMESLDIYRKLATQNPQIYEPEVANTLNNLASLYSKMYRISESELMYGESLEIRRRLATQNPLAHEPGLAIILSNLASLYSKTHRISESELIYNESLEILRRLATQNPQSYEIDLAIILNNFTLFYFNMQRFSESELMYNESLEIRRRLATQNPLAHEPDLATILFNLANLYFNTHRISESEMMYKESLEIYRRLATQNPQTYEPDLAITLSNLAYLYSKTHRISESEMMYKESLEIYRRLATQNPQIYEPDLAITLSGLAFLYSKRLRIAESEKMYDEALEIYKKLSIMNPKLYDDYYMVCLTIQSNNCIFMSKFAEAESNTRKVLDINDKEIGAYIYLATSLLFQGKYKQAEQIYRQYKDELKEGFLGTFEMFEKANVIPKEYKEDVERIRQMLND